MYKEQNDLLKGGPVKWDCVKFGKILYAGRLRKIYIGPRGAKYINVRGRKVYVYGTY